MIEIEIDGRKLKVAESSTIIEAADNAGIYIPRFCYHKKLSIAANCRMCLVEVEKVGKPLPACATPVSAGMIVLTRSQKALQAQRAVMEFLLINHPLDCPICDQGGECELQDLSMGFGRADSEYCEPKRSVASEDIGPLIETWMTRCILCTRCVRFGEEIAGLRELGVIGRGEDSEIGTYVKHFLRSELSGNIIDICPVGALTNKPARYMGRGWEFREHASVAAHDAVGTNIFVHSRGRNLIPQRMIMRAVPRECEAINETWMSDRDRYSVCGLYDKTRVTKPRVKHNGHWIEVEWQRAIDEIVDRVQVIIADRGANQIGALASPNSSVEELFLLQKFMRSLGSHNIDHRMRENDFSDQDKMGAYPSLGLSIAAVEALDAVVLIGSNIRFEQPMLNHRINKAVAEDASVIAINSMDYEFNYPIRHKLIVPANEMVKALSGVAKALADEMGESVESLKAVKPCDTCKAIAAKLKSAEKVALFLGEHAMGHLEAASIRSLANLIARLATGSLSILTAGANGAGAWLAGCIPHRGPAGEKLENKGLSAKEMLTSNPLRAYFLLNTELELDSAYGYAARKALEAINLVVCLTPFSSEAMESYADFILPIAPFTETPGTFVNMEGQWQGFSAATVPHHDSKPAWKVLRVMANFLDLEGFEYKNVHEVQFEIKHAVEKMNKLEQNFSEMGDLNLEPAAGLNRLAPWLMYRVDNLVRRSQPLQETITQEEMHLAINHKLADQLGFSQGDKITAIQGESRITLPLEINNGLADNTVLLPSGLETTLGFGEAFAPITLERGKA